MIKNKLLPFLALLTTTVLWGSTFFIIRDNIATIDPITHLAYRFLIASFLLGSSLAIFKRKKIFSNFKQGVFLGIPLFIFFLLQTLGLKYTTAVNSGFITGLIVIYIPILNYIIWRKLPAIRHVVAIFIAVAGILFMTNGIFGLNRGDFFTLIGASCGALHILLAERFTKKFDIWILNFQQLFIVGTLNLVCIFLLKKPVVINLFSLLPILYLAIFGTVIAFGFILFSQKRLTAITVSLILILEPLFSAIFAWTLGKEKFAYKIAISGSIIIFSLLTSELWPKKNEKKSISNNTSKN